MADDDPAALRARVERLVSELHFANRALVDAEAVKAQCERLVRCIWTLKGELDRGACRIFARSAVQPIIVPSWAQQSACEIVSF